jgi:hypothetical protein
MVLDQTEEGYKVIPAVVQLVNNPYQSLKITSFTVKPSQLFLGFPRNFNVAWGNGLLFESFGWFIELPQDEEQVRNTFTRRLQYKNANISTEIAFARLGDAHKAIFSKVDPWKVQVKEAEVDELMPVISYSPSYDQHDHQLEMAPASQHLPIQQHQPLPYPYNYAYHQSIHYPHNPAPAPMSQEALQRERLFDEILAVVFLGFALLTFGSIWVQDVVVAFLWGCFKWCFGEAWVIVSGMLPLESIVAILVRMGLKTAALA